MAPTSGDQTRSLSERAGIPIIAGSIAGCIEICVTYPFEFAKNSMQVQPGRFRSFFHAIHFNVPLFLKCRARFA